MSKKVLNIEGIKNELEGASLYFTRPTNPPSPTIEPAILPEPVQNIDLKSAPETKTRKTRTRVVGTTTEVKLKNDGINERTDEPTNERMNVKSVHRTKIRHTFDIFADQLFSLREISLNQEMMFGERVLLGDLAQQALDMLIAKEKNK